MSLDLDSRQRAMLAEIGVKVWSPLSQPQAQVLVAQPGVPQPAFVALAPLPVQAPMARPSEHQAPAQASAPRVLRAQPEGVSAMGWPALREAVANCQACKLCNGRSQTVFGVGDEQADWLIVGEAPGEYEDLQGEPYLGSAGTLLDNMLKALGLNRHNKVFMVNALKCRPTGDRNPEPDELAQCEPFLKRQVELLQPKVILAMGRFAVQALLQSAEPIGKLRGQVHQYQGVPVVVTYDPAYLLRSLPDKAKAWADLCLARTVVDQPPPAT